MANDDDARSASPEAPRPRPGPTIELKATEVAREKPPTSQSGRPDAGPPVGRSEPDAQPAPESSSPETSSPESSSQEFPSQASASGAAAPSARPRRPALLWIVIAAFAVGVPLLGAALWFGGAFGQRAAIDDAAQARLAARLDAIEAALARRDAPAVTPPAPERRPDIDTLADLNKRLDEIAEAARQARTRADSAVEAADRAQRAPGVDAASVSPAALEALANRVAALEQSLRDLGASRQAGDADDRAGRLAIAASALRGAVERGAAFAAELAAAKALAADASVLAPVERFAVHGVPAVAALARELAALAPSMLKALGERRPEGNVLDKLQASAERLVRIRPAGEVSGDDPVSVIARIELKAARSDIRGAVADLKRLPDAVRAPAESWIATVEAREAAIAASRRFADEALAALGKTAR